MTSLYTYTALAEGSIRLLSVSEVGEQLTCEFFVCRDDEVPVYDAVSYAWGREDASSKISLDGKYIPITPSVHEMLYQFRTSNPFRKIWIDAICINQADDTEKVQQVRRMHEIYGAAQQVVVWLGRAENQSDVAMDSIPVLHGKFPNTPSWVEPDLGPWPPEALGATTSETVKQFGLPPSSDPVWPALRALYDRSWFKRLWIVQEVVLAKEVTVLCGDRKVDWTALVGLLYSLAKTGEMVLIENPSTSGEEIFLFPYVLGRVKDAFPKALNLRELMFFVEDGRMRQVTEPVDRIYGFLGLARPSIRELIPVDYSENGRAQYWETYVHYGKLFLAEDDELELLSMASSEYKPLSLPSWCPNFNLCKGESSELRLHRDYQAGFGCEMTRAVRTVITPGLNSIQIPGFRIDTVMHVGGSPAPGPVKSQALAEKALAWEAECWKLFLEGVPDKFYNEQSVFNAIESYVRTLVADGISAQRHSTARGLGTKVVGYLGRAWRALVSSDFCPRLSAPPLWEDLQRTKIYWKHHNTVPRTWDWEKAKLHALDDRDLHSLCAFMGVVTSHQGCRMFNTYGNRIGLGPRDTKSGDVVCVLYSAAPVFILRFEGEAREARLVGVAYVDGIMKLDDLPRSDRGKDEMFTIA